MNPNPFRYVNSLHTYVLDLATALEGGTPVVTVVGPYALSDVEDALSDVMGGLPKDLRRLGSSEELASDGRLCQATLVRSMDTPLAQLRDRCLRLGGKLMLAPAGVSSPELAGLGIACGADIGCEAYRATIIDLAAGLCGGSVGFFMGMVKAYADDEHRKRMFCNPLDRSLELGRRAREGLFDERSYAEQEMRAFAGRLVEFARGGGQSAAKAQADILWAWSRGMCHRHNGLWCVDWSLLSSPLGDSVREGASELLRELVVRRVGSAELSAMMPVVERYTASTLSRYAAKTAAGGVADPMRGIPPLSSQVADVYEFSKTEQVRWMHLVGDRVSMFQMLALRNCLCHMNPEGVTNEMLVAFRQALDVLHTLEMHPYADDARCALM